MIRARLTRPATLSGMAFAMSGGGFLLLASREPYGNAAAMGAGFLAVWVSALLLALGMVRIVSGLAGGEPGLDPVPLRGLAAVVSGMVAFALAIRPLGALPAGLCLVAATGWVMGGIPKLRLAVFGLLLATLTVLAFTYGLGVRLAVLPGLSLPI